MIQTAICSYGYSTKVFHAPLIAALPQYYHLSGFVERHNNNAVKDFRDAKIYRSCEELFADPAIDLVIVNTPNPTHFEYAHKALEAGKHVVIDKPFSATSREAETLIQLAYRKNRLLTVYHNRRWEGELLAVKQIVDEKLLGKLHEVEFKFERYRVGLNPKQHKEENSPANGIVYELGTHLIDQAIFIFGLPQAVYAEIVKQREGSSVDDYCCITLYYPDSLKVVLKSSLLVMEQGPAYVMHGSKGSFVKYRANVQETQLSEGLSPLANGFGKESDEFAGRLTTLTAEGGKQTIVYPSPYANYIGFYEQLGKALTSSSPAPVNPQDALNGLRIIESAYKSADEKRVIALNFENQ